MHVAITGATGFLGSALVSRLIENRPEVTVLGLVRGEPNTQNSGVIYKKIGDLSVNTNYQSILSDVNVLVHTAARAHVLHENLADPLKAYRAVNVEGTRRLAEQAAASGVKRLIYLSSINVNGAWTNGQHRFAPDDPTRPEDSNGLSKREAEAVLHDVAARTGLEVVIVRPPLVYGPGVKGNFLSMLQWLNRGIPLPLGSIHNQRSLVGIDNLVDLLITCIDHPAATNQTFLVSDDEDLSTTELLQRMGLALGKPARLIPIPAPLLQLGAQMLGRKEISQRLLGNLQVNISKTKDMLDWTPLVSVDEGLHKTAEWYRSQQ